jgi:transcriptional regulator with PAS, ATPase and Fis domain
VLTIEQCQRISHIPHPVLLIGETGVGKEIIADAIYHEYSGGRNMPFVKINCSAIPRDLLESELFGHEKGAFTGASALKKGKFEQAAGGVLLLDEIGEMSFELQSKLLRVLEAKEFERIGGSRVIPMRARIIASTNQDLKQLVADGKFRMDLYYRLNTFEINIPPLRAHKSDIPLLIRHFIRLDNLQLEFSQDAKEMLSRYDWPGNVRELRNVLIRLSFLYPNTVIDMPQVYNATGEMFHLVKLPEYRSQMDPLPQPTTDKQGNPLPQSAPKPAPESDEILTMEAYEKQILQRAIEKTCGNLTDAAALLGISRSTVYSKVKKYGIPI